MTKPLQRAVPYAPKSQPLAASPARSIGPEDKSEDLTQLASSLNASPTAQRLSSLQRVANGVPAQRMEDDDALQGKMIQRMEDEEALQGKMIQRMDEEEALQGKMMDGRQGAPVQKQADDKGGLPSDLRAGIESLSGMSMDGVKVHRNSSAPAAVQAHAYAQGSDIHLGPGQEKHLPHEAWHVVQQAQGRVKPTMQAKGVAINDDAGLEREADVMGAKPMQQKKSLTPDYSNKDS